MRSAICACLSVLKTGRSSSREEEATEWECRKCGYVHTGKSAPKRCPVCGMDQGWFERKANNY